MNLAVYFLVLGPGSIFVSVKNATRLAITAATSMF